MGTILVNTLLPDCLLVASLYYTNKLLKDQALYEDIRPVFWIIPGILLPLIGIFLVIIAILAFGFDIDTHPRYRFSECAFPIVAFFAFYPLWKGFVLSRRKKKESKKSTVTETNDKEEQNS